MALYIVSMEQILYNKQVSQMRPLLAACRESAGDQNRSPKVPYVFEH